VIHGQKVLKGFARNLKLNKTSYLKFGGSLDQAMTLNITSTLKKKFIQKQPLNINVNFKDKIY
jgi:hypothetical protein